MKTIKFRGKHIETHEWLYGSHFNDGAEDYILPNMLTGAIDFEDYQVDQNTIGQFTGLYDKNGKEIYEGDVFKINELDGVISWHPNGYWCLHTSKDDVSEKSYISLGEVIEYAIREKYDYEVIGNIYDTNTEDKK